MIPDPRGWSADWYPATLVLRLRDAERVLLAAESENVRLRRIMAMMVERMESAGVSTEIFYEEIAAIDARDVKSLGELDSLSREFPITVSTRSYDRWRSEYGADFLWPFREGFRALVNYYRSLRGRG